MLRDGRAVAEVGPYDGHLPTRPHSTATT
ncbi:hypothetical protein [Salinispora pacifica]